MILSNNIKPCTTAQMIVATDITVIEIIAKNRIRGIKRGIDTIHTGGASFITSTIVPVIISVQCQIVFGNQGGTIAHQNHGTGITQSINHLMMVTADGIANARIFNNPSVCHNDVV